MAWLLCCCFVAIAQAADAQVMLNDQPVLKANALLSYWLDETASAPRVERTAMLAALPKIHETLTTSNLGHYKGALWVRLVLHNPGALSLRVLQVAPGHIENVQAWQFAGASLLSPAALQDLGFAGLNTPVLQRPLNATNAAFPLTVPAGVTTLVLRLKTTGSLAPEISIWQPAAWQQLSRLTDWRSGMETGALAFAILVSLSFAFWLRESVWLWHGLTNVGLVLYLSLHSGAGTLWLLPDHAQWTTPVMLLALSLSFVSACAFFIRFFEAAYFPNWSKWVLLGVSALSVIGTVLSLSVDYHLGVSLQYLAGMVLPSLVLVVACWAWWRGFEPARFILVSFGFLTLASISRVAMHKGWVNWPIAVDEWLFPGAAALASASLMLALADQVRRLRTQQAVDESRHSASLQSKVNAATAELALARDEAQAANRFKGAFLARVSHDLRTPLHAFMGYGDLARNALAQQNTPNTGADKAVVMLEAMARSGAGVLSLIDELLQFARGEEGKLTLEPRAVYLSALLRDVIESTKGLAQRHGNQLELQASVAAPVLWLDENRVRQVLCNLISNACAATHDGKITLSVNCHYTESVVGEAEFACSQFPQGASVAVNFSVADNGSGIEPQIIDSLFKPFERGGDAPDVGLGSGFGLGLAICRQSVRLMGSDISVVSTLGKGSDFSFALRTIEANETDVVVPLWSNTTALQTYEAPVRCVLVVDDTPEHRAVMADLLTSLDFDVLQSSSAQQAIDMLQKPLGKRVDLVLTDQYMPDGDGWALLRWCRQSRSRLPVVLLSAAPAAVQGDALKFDAQMLKPVRVWELKQVLTDLLKLNWTLNPAVNIEPEQLTPTETAQSLDALLTNLRQLAFEGRGLEVSAWLLQHGHYFAPELLQQLNLLSSEMQFDRMVTLLDPLCNPLA